MKTSFLLLSIGFNRAKREAYEKGGRGGGAWE